jgi:hypothetical protein
MVRLRPESERRLAGRVAVGHRRRAHCAAHPEHALAMRSRRAIRRDGPPEDIAGPACFLASDESDLLTCQTVLVEAAAACGDASAARCEKGGAGLPLGHAFAPYFLPASIIALKHSGLAASMTMPEPRMKPPSPATSSISWRT